MVEQARSPDQSRSGPVERTLAILELVAERGGAGAREVANALGLPLPTVYRLTKDLVDSDYLVHIRSEGRYELGYKLHRLGLALHRQLGLSRPVAREIAALHESTGFAAYLALYRGGELVLVHVVDSPDCPRLKPLRFGFHEVPHSTAFGKILLADLDPAGRDLFLARHPLRALTANTITERITLDAELEEVARRGISWEHEEFLPGWACAAVPVRGGDSALLGAVAVSAQPERLTGVEQRVAARLRQVASRVGACLRGSET
ncbi:DNA-binding IclR family transcriptional regulator [Microlunatus parietis]|uniref:DNA-binding IclR family transcriptional regulator n=1 Tax=Microlunatus parietis TaxID=682979 RepID=A0A7Y9I9Q4_9ACTN|nr:IclR family transcriptional regulator [Microlunatus parietis]NYE72864.1 DNA-binding IclR family transcriptional regulator [Microlunatus parietis]